MAKLQEKNIVSQTNALIEARYQVTKLEYFLLVAMISLIDPKDKEFLTFQATTEDLCRILGVNKATVLREFDKVTDRLLSRVLKIKTEEGWKKFQWVSYAELKGNSVLLKFHDGLKPHLLELKESGNFTQSRLAETVWFKSVYSSRIYQLLKEYHSKRIYEFEFSLEDFRNMMLGEKSKSYPLYKNFRNKILDTSKKELSELNKDLSTKEEKIYKSDLTFDLTTRRTGRKISHLIFTIKQQQTKPTKIIDIPDEAKKDLPPIILEFHKFGLTTEQVKPYLETRGEASLKLTLAKIKADHKSGKIKSNVSAYAFKLLQENAGQKTPEEIAEEKRKNEIKKAQIEVEKKKLIKELKQSLELEFGKSEREKYINLLSEDEKQNALEQLKDFFEGNPLALGKVNKGDFSSPFISLGINSLIPDFEESRKKYVNEKLKEAGLLD